MEIRHQRFFRHARCLTALDQPLRSVFNKETYLAQKKLAVTHELL